MTILHVLWAYGSVYFISCECVGISFIRVAVSSWPSEERVRFRLQGTDARAPTSEARMGHPSVSFVFGHHLWCSFP